jgi:hypothetical protein
MGFITQAFSRLHTWVRTKPSGMIRMYIVYFNFRLEFTSPGHNAHTSSHSNISTKGNRKVGAQSRDARGASVLSESSDPLETALFDLP